ncbi:halocyanin domain-containing protein [Halostella litorea]|uniref:halocyanin domain-containing protein n=1 Tax=Halostella litorea TaxID=2528831 RepID=UPI0010919549|nr:halocyanin domain-containing protein [Halostella litorea]
MTDHTDLDRRRFLTATAAATASTVLLAGCSSDSGGGDGGGDGGDSDGGGGGGDGGGGSAPSEVENYLSGANNYDGVVDETGSDAVEVAVGPNSENAFGPAAVRVSSGTTVTWDWKNGSHNVIPDTVPDGSDWSGDDSIEMPDYSHEHTFETAGVYLYYCSPHETVGMKGAVVVEE